MKKVTLAKATAPLADYVQEFNKDILVVTVKGKPVAALVPVEGMDYEALSLSTNPQFVDLIEHSRRNLQSERTYSDAEIRREFGLPPYVEKEKA